ncbi:C69 family dipeptidase [Photobacterium aquimaris]|uniref:C69 family dipeptidase n=1 Tax=Photobacterium aquimaris TaxID=512643 RepID=UPI00076A64B6|nr:C69 family dipeptidase [Photobacterium aquimaris]OBU20314.1 hypothetical protein AYY21_03905 [Photobacterium aquimaris]PQJ41226.1 hypothetical protein BTN98_06185 [Photobacterium aquimaris]
MKKGIVEGFGVACVDKTGIWYLETGSGHQWMATKLDNHDYFVSANQSRLQRFLPNDTDKYLSLELINLTFCKLGLRFCMLLLSKRQLLTFFF